MSHVLVFLNLFWFQISTQFSFIRHVVSDILPPSPLYLTCPYTLTVVIQLFTIYLS